MEKICVYTCITGNYDNLKDVIVKEKGVDYVCFTNNREITSSTWKIIYIDDGILNNHYLSRKIKMLGHPYIEDNYDLSIWIDASIIFKQSVKEFIKKYFDLEKDLIAACKHSVRNSITEEAEACIKYKEDNRELIEKLLNFYKKEKFKDDLGLLEMTLIIKRHNNKLVKETMKLWFDMIINYSRRDQLSFMYCIYKTNLPFKVIPLNVWNNEYLEFSSHNSDKFEYNYQVYYNYGNGFNELDSEKIDYLNSGDSYHISLNLKKTVESLRIDLTDVMGISFKFIEFKGIDMVDLEFRDFFKFQDNYITTSNDPQIIINKKIMKGRKIEISVLIKVLKKQDFFDLISSLNDENSKLLKKLNNEKNENSNLNLEINRILNSTSWKITKPLRSVSSLFRK